MPQKKRDHGDGSIYKRESDGKWVGSIKPTHSSKRKVFYGKTELEVKKKLKAFMKELAKNDYIEVQKSTVKDYMDNWLYTVKVNELKPSSFDTVEATLQNQVYNYIGDLQMSSLTHSDIQAMINGLAKSGLSYSTIKKAYNSVNSCFKLAIVKSDLVRNPCAGVSLPKNIKKSTNDIRFFTEEEIERICSESAKEYKVGLSGYRLGQAIILLMYTGLRIGELLGLKWNRVDFDKRAIKVFGSMVTVKNRDDDAASKYIAHYQASL